MAITGIPNLEAFLLAIGKGYVFIGDLETAGGLAPLGATEGEITVEKNDTYNDLKFGEYTGEAVHKRRLSGMNPVVRIPLIVGNPELWAAVSPSGVAGGGDVDQVPVQETSLVIFAEDDLRDGVSFAAGVWDPLDAVPNSFFAWRGSFSEPGISYRQADGGKVISEVMFQVMQGPAHIEPGYKLFAMGGAAAFIANDQLEI